jgi:hypothetical protein
VAPIKGIGHGNARRGEGRKCNGRTLKTIWMDNSRADAMPMASAHAALKHWIAEIRVSVLRFLGTLFSRTEGEKPSFHYFVEGSTAL